MASGGGSGWWRRLSSLRCPQRRAPEPPAREGAPPVPAAAAGAGTFVHQHVEVHVHVASRADAAAAGQAAAAGVAAALGLTPCGAGAAPAKKAPAAGAASSVARQGPIAGKPARPRDPSAEAWAYAVWRHPSRPELRGVHCGGGAAWKALAPTLPGRRYCFAAGTRLRRFPSEREALEGYEAEAAAHGAPLPAPVFDLLEPRLA